MPVAQLSLNELARRVGLAKSNVLRYFESREAVLLELLDAALAEWLSALAEPGALPTGGTVAERAEQVATAMADSLAARPVLCDLLSAQASVLERNVSAAVAAQYKHATLDHGLALTRLMTTSIPEIDAGQSLTFVGAAIMSAGALWAHSHPSAAMLAAYAADPELAAMRLDFTDSLRTVLAVLLTGLLHRPQIPPTEKT